MSQTSSSNIPALILFEINHLLCGFNIKEVLEINKKFRIAEVYGTSEQVRGVINLRGEIVSVIELRMAFGFESIGVDNMSRIIMLEGEDENVGVLVDSVDDVVYTDDKFFEQKPANISGIDATYFNGIYKLDNKIVAIINSQRILKISEAIINSISA